jgi:hypothetical protein
MAFLGDFLTEQELADLLKAKFGFGGRRMLRGWRQARKGPPWVKRGKFVAYPAPGFEQWLSQGKLGTDQTRLRKRAGMRTARA